MPETGTETTKRAPGKDAPDVGPPGGPAPSPARMLQPHQWTVARRAAFLDLLAMTCNVAQSAKVVGCSTRGVYALRRRDAAFAEQWRLAIDEGYDHLEAKVLALALGYDDEGATAGGPGAVDPRPFDRDGAVKLVRQHQAMRASGATHNERRRTPFAFKHAPIDEVRDALLAKLAARAKRCARSGPA